MRRKVLRILFISYFFILLSACGVKGPPLPPETHPNPDASASASPSAGASDE